MYLTNYNQVISEKVMRDGERLFVAFPTEVVLNADTREQLTLKEDFPVGQSVWFISSDTSDRESVKVAVVGEVCFVNDYYVVIKRTTHTKKDTRPSEFAEYTVSFSGIDVYKNVVRGFDCA